ncbi:hypothetical protein ALC53_04709 [Atta colombica]|uniref:Uncharacterized protein n=1 Tax=Atta colombica TaxID=520822 RepID=A0A195BJV1_9HYME|nr:hypothetical protein ALC53_04709 [Atta colombica]
MQVSALPGKGDLVLRAFPNSVKLSSERATTREAADRTDWPGAIVRISDQHDGDVTRSAPVCDVVGEVATAATRWLAGFSI